METRYNGPQQLQPSGSVPDRLEENVLKRDNYTCVYCGFQAKKCQRAIRVDDNNDGNGVRYITVCGLCNYSNNIAVAGVRDAGFMAYIPELSQEDVNNIARLCLVVMSMADNKANAKGDGEDRRNFLNSIYQVFISRAARIKVDGRLVDVSRPEVWVGYKNRRKIDDGVFNEIIKDLRFVPTRKGFDQRELTYYVRECKEKFTENVWAIAAETLMNRLGKQGA